jgi:hypothetical protein
MEWSATRPGRALPPGKGPPRYPLYRRLGGPQSRSGHRGYRKNPFRLCRGSNLDRPVFQEMCALCDKFSVDVTCLPFFVDVAVIRGTNIILASWHNGERTKVVSPVCLSARNCLHETCHMQVTWLSSIGRCNSNLFSD